MKFLDFKSIKIFFEFVKEHHYTFYIIFFIGYVLSCYIYFYHFFSRFDFDYIQYFSLSELLKLSGIDTLKVFGISILLALFISFISLYITYLIFVRNKFKELENQIDLIMNEIDNVDELNELDLEELESIEKEIKDCNSREEFDSRNLIERFTNIKNRVRTHKNIINKSKDTVIQLKENLKIKFSLFNLVILAVNFIWYNNTYSEIFIKKHEYPTVTINFTEENKIQDYKLLGNLETSILLSDDKLTKLEIIEKSNILSINIKSNEKLEENYFVKGITYFKEIIIKISSFFNKNKEDN